MSADIEVINDQLLVDSLSEEEKESPQFSNMLINPDQSSTVNSRNLSQSFQGGFSSIFSPRGEAATQQKKITPQLITSPSINEIKDAPMKTQLTRNSTVSVTDLQNAPTERLRTEADRPSADDKSNISLFQKDQTSQMTYRRNHTSMIFMDQKKGFATSREIEKPHVTNTSIGERYQFQSVSSKSFAAVSNKLPLVKCDKQQNPIQLRQVGDQNTGLLTNEFNDLCVVDQLKRNLKQNLTKEYKIRLTKNIMDEMQTRKNNKHLKDCPVHNFATYRDQDRGSQKSLFYEGLSQIPQLCSLDKTASEKILKATENESFQQHFDVELVISVKCQTCICYKLRNRRFFLKRLPKEITKLQSFIDKYESQKKCQVNNKIQNQSEINIQILDSWINLIPQLPYQNFVNCYGMLKKNDQFYTISDLIIDHTDHVSQINEVESYHERADQVATQFEKGLAYESSVSEHELTSGIAEETLSEDNTSSLSEKSSKKSRSQIKTLKNISSNVSEKNRVSLGNSPVKRRETFKKGTTTQSSASIFKRGVKANKSVRSIKRSFTLFKPSSLREIVPELYQDKATFYGIRKGLSNICIAKNMYDTIKSFELGNLSSLTKIPQQYMRCLLGYIIQISRTMAHAHQNGLVHGCYNLSKVIVQQKKMDNAQFQRLKRKNNMKKDVKSMEMYNQHEINYNFFLTNFEPFQVEKMLQSFTQQKDDYKEIFKIDSMKVDRQGILRMVKIQDMQAFAHSIVEIMVGRSEEAPPLRQPNLSNKNSSSGIPLDSIPLNWSKAPETRYIFQILKLCYGSFDSFHSQDVDTSDIFNQIHEIASRVYVDHYNNDDITGGRYTIQPQILNRQHENRLNSAVLNNSAVINFLNFTEESSPVEARHIFDKSYKLLSQAVQLSPANQVAKLNRLLLMFQRGLMRDQQFHKFLQHDISLIDKELAFCIYILFKKNVQGCEIFEKEYKDLVKMCEKKNHMISNITRMLFDHPDFLLYKKTSIDVKKARAQLDYIKKNYMNEKKAYQNHKIEIEPLFNVQGIFFSSNDMYMTIIGIYDLIIVDCRTGLKVYKQMLPQDFEQQAQQENNASETESQQSSQIRLTESQSIKADKRSSSISRQNQSAQIGKQILSSRQSMGQSAQSMSSARSKSGNLMVSRNGKMTARNKIELLAITENYEPIYREKKILIQKYPYQWESCVGNTGKQLLLYDRSQQIRNKHYYYHHNREELILIYTIVLSKTTSFEPTIHKLNMIELLDNQEVLSFGLDDYTNENFTLISVVAKDLHIYIIDFERQIVTKKITSVRFHPYMKSIFFNIHKKYENQVHFTHLKEYVQEQKRLGNVVKMPKINEDIILIQEGKTNAIKIYNIKNREIVRQFLLEKEEQFFEYENENSHLKHDCSENSDDNYQLFTENDHLGRAMAAEESSKKTKYRSDKDDTKQLENFNLSSPGQPEQDLKLLEISPNATLIAAQFGNEVLIKVLNQVEREQRSNTLDYHQSLTFLPIYMDEDYNFQHSKKLYHDKMTIKRRSTALSKVRGTSLAGNSSAWNPLASSYVNGGPELTPREVLRYLKDFQALKGYTGSIYIKNQKILALRPFIRIMMSNPKSLFDLNFRKGIRSKKQQEFLELFRSYQTIEPDAVKYNSVDTVEPFLFFDQFQFKRSNEFVKAFECTSNPRQSLIAVIINRSLQVIDFIDGSLILEAKLPDFVPNRINNSSQKSIFFVDNDQLIVVQDGGNRLHIISIGQMTETYAKTRKKNNKNEDSEIRMEGPKQCDIIDMGFGYLKDKMSTQEKESGEDSQIDDTDEASGIQVLNYKYKIDNVFCTRNQANYGQIAVISQFRFSIYYMYDEDCPSALHDLLWDCDYRFKPEIKKYGQHQCIDFEDQCTNFVSGTSLGYICHFNLTEKMFKKAYLVKDPTTGKPEQISIIKDVTEVKKVAKDIKLCDNHPDEDVHGNKVPQDDYKAEKKKKDIEPLSKKAITYSHRSKLLMITEMVGFQSVNLTGPALCRSQILRHNNFQKGNITNLKTDLQIKNLFASFQNADVLIFNLESLKVVKQIQALNNTGSIFIDDYITYTAHIDPNNKSVRFSIFNWDFETIELKKPKYFESSARENEKLQQKLKRIGKLKQAQKDASAVYVNPNRVNPTDLPTPLDVRIKMGFVKKFKEICSPRDSNNDFSTEQGDGNTQMSKTCSIF